MLGTRPTGGRFRLEIPMAPRHLSAPVGRAPSRRLPTASSSQGYDATTIRGHPSPPPSASPGHALPPHFPRQQVDPRRVVVRASDAIMTRAARAA